jgi:probable addiction module antidote protein
MAAKTTPWEPTLDTEAHIRVFLEAAFEDGDPQTIASALGWVARARSIGKIAESAGLGRESLYKSLSENGNPHLATVIKVMRALGYRLALADMTPGDQSR